MTHRDDDDRLRAYIDRLVELESDEGPTLGQENLREIAREMGVDEAVLQRAEERAHETLAKGCELRAAGRFTDAIFNLRVATDLRPYDVAPARELGRTYQLRRRDRPNRDGKDGRADKVAAGQWLQRALELDPRDLDSKRFLGELDTPSRRPVDSPEVVSIAAAAPAAGPNKAALMLVIGLAFAGFITALVTILVVQRADDGVKAAATRIATQPRPIRTPAPRAQPRPNTKPSSANKRTPIRHRPMPDGEVPLVLADDPRLGDAKLVNMRSTLNIYGRKGWYKAAVELLWNGDKELSRLDLMVEGLDASGKVILVKSIKAIRERAPGLRPGDRLPLRVLARAKPALKSVRIKPLVVYTRPAAKRYKDARPVQVEWIAEQPEGVELRFGARREIGKNRSDGRFFHDVSLEVTNTGERALALGKLQARYYDKAGNIMDTVDRFVLITSDPPLMPGTTRLKRIVHIVRSRPASWSLAIIDAR